MLRFLDGILLGTTSQAGTPVADANAGGGGNRGTPSEEPAAAGASKPANGAANGAWSFPTDKPFAEYLPEAYKADPNFRDIKSFEDLAKGYVNAQKLVGLDKNKLVALPKDDNDNEALANVYKALGRPEKVDGYQLPKPEGGKDYSAADLAFQKEILPVLHEAGISQRQLAAIVPKWNALQSAAAAAMAQKDQAELAEADKALSTEFGAAKAQKLALANDALGYFADALKLGDGLKHALERSGPDGKKLGNDPAFAKLFAHLGAQMKEDGLIGKGGAGVSDASSPNEAKQEIAALQGDQKFMRTYMNKNDPGHAEAVAKMQRLFQSAHPEGGGKGLAT